MRQGGGAGNRKSVDDAERALARIRSQNLAADPKSVELWQAYESGDSATLRAAVDARLASGAPLKESDVASLYEAQIGPLDPGSRIDDCSKEAEQEIAKLVALIESAQGVATEYARTLEVAGRSLEQTPEREAAMLAASALIRVTKSMADRHGALRTRLQAMAREMTDLRGTLDGVRRECFTDALTALGNRRQFDAALKAALASARKRKETVSVLLADIDRFKEVNDVHGRQTGDRVLRFVALTIQRNIADQDIAARYGGEEFAVILPGTGLKGAVRLAQQIRAAVVNKDLVRHLAQSSGPPLTISIGVAAAEGAMRPQALIEAAEFCLLAAKRAGRNRVVGADDDELLDALGGDGAP